MDPFFGRRLAAALLFVSAAAVPASASGIYDIASITGTFSNPVLTSAGLPTTGIVIDPGNGFQQILPNNSATAIVAGIGTNDLTWGNVVAPGTTPSRLRFIGSTDFTVPGCPPNPCQTFDLGRLEYTNGSSDITTLIFAVTFTMTVNLVGGGTVPITPYVGSFRISTTINNHPDPTYNADFIDVLDLQGSTTSFDALEQESKVAAAILSGQIVGDPFLDFTGIRIAPGSEDVGFIGHGVADFAAPEPATLLLLGSGLAAVLARRCRRR